jgi:hypothetical protein
MGRDNFCTACAKIEWHPARLDANYELVDDGIRLPGIEDGIAWEDFEVVHPNEARLHTLRLLANPISVTW